jgi:hypothetical protein
MKRSTINARIRAAIDLFDSYRFALPPFASWSPAAWREAGTEADELRRCRLGWDLTDFGRGDFTRCGLLLFTLRNGRATASPIEEVKPYAEKIMIVGNAQVTPWHYHLVKMEDIINRGGGRLVVDVCRADVEGRLTDDTVGVSIDGVRRSVAARGRVELSPGESITLPPRLAHQFTAVGGAVVAGEVSSLNDDETDNYFIDPVSRFPSIEEDEPAEYLLCTEYS